MLIFVVYEPTVADSTGKAERGRPMAFHETE